MALPKINDLPNYTVVIPSTGKTVKFRPYLVREEKTLLIASESQDMTLISNTILELINCCIVDPIDVKVLTPYDVEYLFTQIRAKSVGETTVVLYPCHSSECAHVNEVSINLTDIKVNSSSANKSIKLTDTVTIEMKHIPYYDYANRDIIDSESDTETLYKTVVYSIEAVCTEDERILVKDEPIEDVFDFVNDLKPHQFELLKEFIENNPTLSYDAHFTCEKCSQPNTIYLRGLSDFF
jgi:hypothetical protein